MDLDQKIRDKSATIAVIGMGYVGLPTAVNFAEHGFKVIGVNRTREKVDLINRGGCYLKDLNIDERVRRVVQSENLLDNGHSRSRQEERRNRNYGANAGHLR